MTAATEAIRDPGLQAERTALAWTRTAFAVLANALLAARSGLASDSPAVTALAFVLLAAAAAAVAYGARRRHALRGIAPAVAAPSHRAMGLTALLALTTCGVGLAAIALTPR
ncbi:MAG TPA: DUF202 domain-containing protein [Caldimonas sp.]|nr:DUF202 domain-containing protein [Caldimonas sp.]